MQGARNAGAFSRGPVQVKRLFRFCRRGSSNPDHAFAPSYPKGSPASVRVRCLMYVISSDTLETVGSDTQPHRADMASALHVSCAASC